MHCSSKRDGFAAADFLLVIIGKKSDYNQLFIAKQEQFKGRNSKNGKINVFVDHFQLILMGFLTTSFNKNSQNDLKLLETLQHTHDNTCYFLFDPLQRLLRAEILQKILVLLGATEFQEKMLLRFPDLYYKFILGQKNSWPGSYLARIIGNSRQRR